MNPEDLISKLYFTQIFCMSKRWSDDLSVFFLADLDNKYCIKLLHLSLNKVFSWKVNSPGNYLDDIDTSVFAHYWLTTYK